MAEGYLDWTTGMFPTAAQIEEYLQLQTVMRFADATARNAALNAIAAEGMVVYLKDSNSLSVEKDGGGNWCTSGPIHGALLSYTPAVVQSGSVTVTNTYSRYQRIGRMIHGWVDLSVTGSGTGANVVTITTPFTAATSGNVVGSGELYDTSVGTHYAANVFLASTTTFDLRVGVAATVDNRLGITSFAAALASGDLIKFHFAFESAADS